MPNQTYRQLENFETLSVDTHFPNIQNQVDELLAFLNESASLPFYNENARGRHLLLNITLSEELILYLFADPRGRECSFINKKTSKTYPLHTMIKNVFNEEEESYILLYNEMQSENTPEADALRIAAFDSITNPTITNILKARTNPVLPQPKYQGTARIRPQVNYPSVDTSTSSFSNRFAAASSNETPVSPDSQWECVFPRQTNAGLSYFKSPEMFTQTSETLENVSFYTDPDSLTA